MRQIQQDFWTKMSKHYQWLTVMLLLFCLYLPAHAQIRSMTPMSGSMLDNNDTSKNITKSNQDTTIAIGDTILSDSAKVQDVESRLGIKISKDALEYKVEGQARDSMVVDAVNNRYDMYGDVSVKYNDLNLNAGRINFVQKTHILTASPERDTAGRIVSNQKFNQASQEFTYDSIQYNFDSKRAIVKNAKSQYGEGYIRSEQIKRNADETIYGFKNGYTTCDLDTPHFSIRSRKIKVVPGKIVASGPANLELQHVPTPLWLPFGVFPISEKQRSGFIIPSYTMEENRGIGLQRGGYYFALSDYFTLTTQFDIFSKGSWGFLGRLDYAKRYHYNGSLQVGYNYTKSGEIYESSGGIGRDFSIVLNHSQDAKARPGTTLSASVNIATQNYNKLNGADAMQMLNNSFSSSISYSKNWVGKPYSLSAALRHSQNTNSGQFSVTLPDINFAITQITPFQRKNPTTSTPRWYEKISASYNLRAVNEWNFYDSTFSWKSISFDDFNNGIIQNLNVTAAYNVLRFFNLSFSMPYTEYWNTKKVIRSYNSSSESIDTAINSGFFTSRSFNIGSSLSTRIYGVKMFKKGKLMGIRHVITPQVGFTYTPGFGQDPFNYMYYTALDPNYAAQYYSPYIGPYSPIGGPSNGRASGAITFGLQNNLQMKVRTKDSTGSKNISLLDAFSINSQYNLFADSLNLSPIAMRAQTTILKIINISGSANFEAYKRVRGVPTREFLINTGRGLLDFRNASLAVGFSYRGQKKNEKQQNDSVKNNDQVKSLLGNGGIDDYYDFNVPWNVSVNYSLSAGKRYLPSKDMDSLAIQHALMFTGGLNLTDRWQLNVQSGYNFTLNEIGLTSINISRDLHCWQMSLNLVPFGQFRSFNFLLQVKSSVLQDLKLVRRKTYLDNK